MLSMPNFNANTPQTLLSKRLVMIQARKNGEKVKSILIRFNVSRPVFYKFYNRYSQYGKFGLYNLSRAPHYHGLKTPVETEEEVKKLYQKYPYFSSYEINSFTGLNPCLIQRIYKRNNLVKIYKPKKEKKRILEKLKKEFQRKRKTRNSQNPF